MNAHALATEAPSDWPAAQLLNIPHLVFPLLLLPQSVLRLAKNNGYGYMLVVNIIIIRPFSDCFYLKMRIPFYDV